MNERTKEYLVLALKNWLAFLTPEKLNLDPGEFQVEYLADLPGGALIAVDDPTLGRRVFEVKVVQRKNMRWEKPLPSSAVLDDQGENP